VERVKRVANMKRLKTFPSGWQTRIDTPCPLLAPCTECGSLLPVINFYKTKTGRKTILGDQIVSACSNCAIERYKRLDPRLKLFYAAKKRAKECGFEFSLSLDDIVIPETCPILGVPIEDGTGRGRAMGNHNLNSASIDRIDNDVGYSPKNIAVISRRANRIKNDSSLSELACILDYMINRLPAIKIQDKQALAKLKQTIERTTTDD
jgi:hypothetical protein